MNEEPRPVCPKCGSALIQPITNALRCGACGHQFAEVKDVISESAERRRREGFQGNWRQK